MFGVRDFRVELHSVDVLVGQHHRGDDAVVVSMPSTSKPSGSVSTESPWLTHTSLASGTPSNKLGGLRCPNCNFANPYFSRIAGLDCSTWHRRRQQLMSVTDAEYRHAHGKNRRMHARRTWLGDAARAARDDDAADARKLIGVRVDWKDVTLDAGFAHAARQEMTILPARVEYGDALHG